VRQAIIDSEVEHFAIEFPPGWLLDRVKVMTRNLRMLAMNIITAFPWPLPGDRGWSAARPRDRLCVAAAMLDSVFVSALLWIAILRVVH
jgi:hypothetical protein